MLILSRKANEQIHIGDKIVLSVVEVQGNRVRIGIEAPPEVNIVRGELHDKRKAAEKSPPRILIVDDSPEDRQLVRRYIAKEARDFQIAEADLGEQGLDLCRQQKPDCVLLDYRLPDINGIEFLGELRRSAVCRDIPVILMTGCADQKLAVAARKHGARELLLKKEFSPHQLQDAICKALRPAAL